MEGTTTTTTTTTSASTAAEETQQQSQQQNQESLIQRGIRGIWGYFAGSAEDAASASENSGDIKLDDFGAKEVENSSGEEAGAATSEEDEKSKEVCKFFLEARCRFGHRCHNLHPEDLSPSDEKSKKGKRVDSKKKKSDESDKKKSGKKRPMKTSMDVIQRIQWDSDLPAEYFYVGYIDRFKGIQEEPFSRFSHWGDLANAEYEALAVPQHRVQYFKYKDAKVWDKAQRLDVVFGSTENGSQEEGGIVGFMNRVDDRIRQQIADGTFKQKKSVNDEEEDDYDDSDSDDDGIDINVDADEISTAAPGIKVDMIPEEERSTHFLAIRITDAEIADNVNRLQQHIVDQEEDLSECCMPRGLLHVTLGMLRLSGQQGEEEAARMLDELRPVLNEFGRRRALKLNIRGLDTFGQRVLYGAVQPEPKEEDFWEFVSEVKNRVSATSDAVSVTNKFEFTPHLTVCKVSRPVSRLRRSKYLPSALYEGFEGTDFGTQEVDNLQLCVIEQTTRSDGFYRTVNEILLED